MTTRIGASVFVDPTEIRHDVSGDHGTLCFGPWPTVQRVDVHFDDTAGIDAVIAELVALRNEMTGDAALRAADRCTCGHPAYLHGDSVTGVHGYCTKCEADACNMFELAEPAAARGDRDEAAPEYPAVGSAIPPENNGGMTGYIVGECGHRVAGSEWKAGFRRCEHCGPDLGDDEDDDRDEAATAVSA